MLLLLLLLLLFFLLLFLFLVVFFISILRGVSSVSHRIYNIHLIYLKFISGFHGQLKVIPW